MKDQASEVFLQRARVRHHRRPPEKNRKSIALPETHVYAPSKL